MQKSLFPGYTIGPDAYEDIVNVCPAYGKKVAIIGGKQALAAAKDKILKAMGVPLWRSPASSGTAARHLWRIWICCGPRWRTRI